MRGVKVFLLTHTPNAAQDFDSPSMGILSPPLFAFSTIPHAPHSLIPIQILAGGYYLFHNPLCTSAPPAVNFHQQYHPAALFFHTITPQPAKVRLFCIIRVKAGGGAVALFFPRPLGNILQMK